MRQKWHSVNARNGTTTFIVCAVTGERIKQAAEALGGVPALEKASGIPRRTLYDLANGKRRPKIHQLEKISRATGQSVEWLMSDPAREHQRATLSAISGAIAKTEREDTAKDRNAKRIPNLLTHAGMGNGGLEHIEIDEGGQPFDLYTDGAWSFPSGIAGGFRHFTGVYALEVEGDSMEPTYAGGSTVFVDTRRKDPRSPGCFIVDYGDGLMLKRIELIGGTDQMAVISDNKDFYRSYEFPRDQVHIWGRVVAKWEWVK